MKENQAISSLLKRLWHHVSLRRRGQFGLLLVLMLLASFAEIVSIGAVLPFLGALTSPERIFNLPTFQPFIKLLKLTEASQLILPLTIAFAVAALIAGGMRLLLLWATMRLSYAAGADISLSVYSRTLYQPYSVHCSRNSSEIINAISSKTGNAINSIINILSLISSSIILAAILFALLVLDPIIALLAFGGFALIYAFIISLTRSKLQKNSEIYARESTQVIKSLNEGLGGIRDVLIDGSQAAYCQIYSNADIPLRRVQGDNMFISSSPRYAMEALGMTLIAMLAYFLAQQPGGVAKALPILGTLALGAQRLLPVLQQIYSSWTSINAEQASLRDVIELLNQEMPSYANEPEVKPLIFLNSISFNDVSFSYDSKIPFVLKRINLRILKGSRVGFIGETGSGKSTLLDILMGLLSPTDGALEIDGQAITPANCRGWQAHIAHVPQVIFLADSTIEENIAFGVPKDKIDHERVRIAAKQAQIAASIDGLPEKYQTFVGERGVRLSGGQRQRIGIARALYKQANVIVFDEATSALDNATESAVMDVLNALSEKLTLLIIAHRLSTLKNCTHIFEIGEGSIKRQGCYKDIVNENK
ncbi:MAG: ABC transporter ATP-binding protein/permease [Candidatus Methylopumilus sp.]|nr:ABC transporter ATP-binding protein/permease [Sulfuritalea sp.]MCF8193328.1 ABC transporter ATP-binding protein/permease [Candidatus Methylopumilus sp.]